MENLLSVKPGSMKKITLFITFISVFVIHLHAQKINEELNSLLKIYDTTVVLNASLNINSFSNTLGQLKNDSLIYDNAINSIFLSNKNRTINLLNKIKKSIREFNSKQQDLFIYKIREWCEVYSILIYPFRTNDKITFEEIIYNVEKSRNIFMKYLDNKNQTWESLSTYQSNSIYYDFMNLILGMDQKQQVIYYSKFFQKYSELLK